MSGVEALARALGRPEDHYEGHMVVWKQGVGFLNDPEEGAAALLAALSTADKLAIAGITAETLATALDDSWGPADVFVDDSEVWATLANRAVALLATPVAPEGGEL